MDIITHALIGKAISLFDKKARKKTLLIILLALIPDLVLIPFYIVLGKEHGRFLWIAQNGDWISANANHPLLSGLYNTTHSLFFLGLVVLPVILIFKLPWLCFFSYFSHILFDIFTHTGEWAIQIFYPFSSPIFGFSDAWAWPLHLMAACWFAVVILIFCLKFLKNKYVVARHKS